MFIFIFGVLCLGGALFLLFVCVALMLAEPLAIPMVVGVLAFAWWLAGKDWGIAKLLREPAPIKQKSLRTTRYPDRHLELPRPHSSLDDSFDDEDCVERAIAITNAKYDERHGT